MSQLDYDHQTEQSPMTQEIVPQWASWLVSSQPRLHQLVLYGRGASVIGPFIEKRGNANQIHIIETDKAVSEVLATTFGGSDSLRQGGLTLWRSTESFSEGFRPEDSDATTGIALLPGAGEGIERILELSPRSIWIASVCDFLAPASEGRRSIEPIELLHLVTGFAPIDCQRIDGLDCMAFKKPDANDAAALLAHDVTYALVSATDAASRRRIRGLETQLKRLKSESEVARANSDFRKRELAQLRGSVAYRLARSVADVAYSPKQVMDLPRLFVQEGRRYLDQRNARRLAASADSAAEVGKLASSTHPLSTYELDEAKKSALKAQTLLAMSEGVAAIESMVLASCGGDAAPPGTQALALLVAAQACSSEGRHDLEFQLAERAIAIHRSVGILRGYLHAALRSRQMEAADEALRELVVLYRGGSGPAGAFLEKFRHSSTYKLAVLAEIPARPERWHWPRSNRLAYVLHNSLPYSSGGYATRSHGVASGLVASGRDVVCLTRPGFPIDIKPELVGADLPLQDVIDGVRYLRRLSPARTGVTEYEYIMRSVREIQSALLDAGAGYVQAASNYVTGLPALIAARRLGLPFFYEVRGLWEITRISREPEFESSAAFAVQRQIESVLAREADHVFTLTEPMREELIERGVAADRITLLPNSVDAEKFVPLQRDDTLAARLGIPAGVPVIGYIGTFVAYEGLEDLTLACVKLHESGQDFRLMLIGNENASGQGRGPISEEIIRIAAAGGIAEKVIMPGRIPHEEVAAHYSLVDISPFPRKPWPVCEMVSPMKPLEALAMEKAVIVSSVRALKEMIEDGVTGRVFEKGNVDSLFRVMWEMILDPSQRELFGKQGRRWVRGNRTWSEVAGTIEAQIAGADRCGPRQEQPLKQDDI